MEEQELKKGFRFEITDYKNDITFQKIIGITFNKANYGNFKEYEFNVWIWFYGFHLIYTK